MSGLPASGPAGHGAHRWPYGDGKVTGWWAGERRVAGGDIEAVASRATGEAGSERRGGDSATREAESWTRGKLATSDPGGRCSQRGRNQASGCGALADPRGAGGRRTGP